MGVYWHMRPLVDFVERVTRKEVVEVGEWYQDEETIYVDYADLEGLLHELGHWVAASDREREWPNLMLDERRELDLCELPWWARQKRANVRRGERREAEAVYLAMRALVDITDDPEVWFRRHERGGSSAYYTREMGKNPKLRRRCCKRLSARRPYPEFMQELREALFIPSQVCALTMVSRMLDNGFVRGPEPSEVDALRGWLGLTRRELTLAELRALEPSRLSADLFEGFVTVGPDLRGEPPYLKGYETFGLWVLHRQEEGPLFLARNRPSVREAVWSKSRDLGWEGRQACWDESFFWSYVAWGWA